MKNVHICLLSHSVCTKFMNPLYNFITHNIYNVLFQFLQHWVDSSAGKPSVLFGWSYHSSIGRLLYTRSYQILDLSVLEESLTCSFCISAPNIITFQGLLIPIEDMKCRHVEKICENLYLSLKNWINKKINYTVFAKLRNPLITI